MNKILKVFVMTMSVMVMNSCITPDWGRQSEGYRKPSDPTHRSDGEKAKKTRNNNNKAQFSTVN